MRVLHGQWDRLLWGFKAFRFGFLASRVSALSVYGSGIDGLGVP